MKKRIFFSLATAAAITAIVSVACKKNVEQFDARGAVAGNALLDPDPCGCRLDNGQYADTVTLPNVINTNTTLTCGTLWLLDGKTYVSGGAQLTIDAGARIEGVRRSTADSASALIITRGSTISADASPSCPIVFTSHSASPAPGDWGGIVLLGSAPINRADTTIEGIGEPSLPTGVDINYGGGGAFQGDSAASSGILRYVRIEYAGAVITEGNELNALTCGGVGAGTTLSYIQTAYGADDGFEFFGGTVNADHLISYGNNDDDLDFDFAWRGVIQFVVASKVPDLPYSPNPNGIESDNNPGSAASAQPRTNDSAYQSLLTNLTIIGSDGNCPANTKGLLDAARFRQHSHIMVRNSIFMDYPTGLNALSATTAGQVNHFRYNLVHANNTVALVLNSPFDISPLPNNTFTGCGGNSSIGMTDPYAATPNYLLTSGSPALNSANFNNLPGFPYYTPVSYRGAFDDADDWTLGWTRWNF